MLLNHRVGRLQGGFTFAELLAAMLFIGILIPAVIEALHLASAYVGIVERRTEAARLASCLLNELALNNTASLGSGFSQETMDQLRDLGERFSFRVQTDQRMWEVDSSVSLVTVYVFYPARGQEHYVAVSTLIPSSATTQQSSTQTQGPR